MGAHEMDEKTRNSEREAFNHRLARLSQILPSPFVVFCVFGGHQHDGLGFYPLIREIRGQTVRGKLFHS